MGKMLTQMRNTLIATAKRIRPFLHSEQAGGRLLMLATALSVLLANSPWSSSYIGCWDQVVFHHSLSQWINDAVMAFFFLLVGLELKREVLFGLLSKWQFAVMPMAAAIGGMLVPVLIFAVFNYNTTTLSGAGIPMATDIAFALAILALGGKAVPYALKVFLTALAVIDDLGAIAVIAVGYTKNIQSVYLGLAGGLILCLYLLHRKRVSKSWPYMILGLLLWIALFQSGVHATLAGVILALFIPLNNNEEPALASQWQHFLHVPVALLVLPLFALANTALPLGDIKWATLTAPLAMGIFWGLFLGKPLGILGGVWVVQKAKWGQLPAELSMKHILLVGIMGGIGFTMSLFISMLALDQASLIQDAKMVVLLAAVFSSVAGIVAMKLFLKR
ncbi:MAG: Na+/H+ antiporter NhaA [Flavobacterium sp. BFFFF2]|nr:MAG: Na+/H+ antiporter NhaA [Flavobacterium sp. BFFFF2]